MKAILIKPDEKAIEEVDFKGTLEHAYELLGVRLIERVELANGDDVWLDEEGLLNGAGDRIGWFEIGRTKYFNEGDLPGGKILAGRGLITGNIEGDEGEEWGDVKTSLEDAKTTTRFLSVATVDF